jgi:hypothetical protein
MLGISWAGAQLAASQEGLSSMSQWVSDTFLRYYEIIWTEKLLVLLLPEGVNSLAELKMNFKSLYVQKLYSTTVVTALLKVHWWPHVWDLLSSAHEILKACEI